MGYRYDEHDITKKMLNVIRESKRVNLLENSSMDVDETQKKDEESSFMELVTSRVSFNEFKIYPEANNVIFSGQFDNGIKWQFSKVDGLYLDIDNEELTVEVLDTLKKLEGYYQKWLDEWGEKMNTEYKSKNEGENIESDDTDNEDEFDSNEGEIENDEI